MEHIYTQFIDSLWRESGQLPLEIVLPPQLARALAQSLGLPWTALPTETVSFTWATPYGAVQITSASYV